MLVEELVSLLRKLGSRKVVEFDEWVMGSCPFAPYTHQKRTDRKPSFGIRKGEDNVYHCFSCGSVGKIQLLPTNLEFVSGKSYQHIRDFIQNSTNTLSIRDNYDNPIHKTLKEIPLSVYHRYPVMKEWYGLTKADIAKWDIRYDTEWNRILYPIFTSTGKLVGIRGRSLTEKFFVSYTHLVPNSLDPKAGGIWFGMVHPLVEGKYLIITEGERDAILLKRYVTNVWASMGASISGKQMENLAQVTNPILLFFDNDTAGKEGMRKIVKKLNRRCRRLREYFGCKDPAEAVSKGLITKLLSSDNIIQYEEE